jgi:glycosyltransferase involved in cell wall biosynthesis
MADFLVSTPVRGVTIVTSANPASSLEVSSPQAGRTGLAVLIPAHDEEAVIGACLHTLLTQDFDGLVQVIVVANGCSDATVEVAESFSGKMRDRGFTLVVVAINKRSKSSALNVADSLARFSEIIYLDADVELSANALSSVAAAFDRGVLFCSPRLVPLGASYCARAYGRVWSAVPYVRDDVIGAGFYAVRGDGRRRWSRFPDIVADDKFARLHFSPAEREVLRDATFYVHLPVGLRELVRVRSRWIRANRQLRLGFPALTANDRPRWRGMLRFVAGHPSCWRDVPAAAVVYLLADIRAMLPQAPGDARWERAKRARDLRRVGRDPLRKP